jgi:hypothetical protein
MGLAVISGIKFYTGHFFEAKEALSLAYWPTQNLLFFSFYGGVVRNILLI